MRPDAPDAWKRTVYAFSAHVAVKVTVPSVARRFLKEVAVVAAICVAVEVALP
jgi:hypothetical protein